MSLVSIMSLFERCRLIVVSDLCFILKATRFVLCAAETACECVRESIRGLEQELILSSLFSFSL